MDDFSCAGKAVLEYLGGADCREIFDHMSGLFLPHPGAFLEGPPAQDAEKNAGDRCKTAFQIGIEAIDGKHLRVATAMTMAWTESDAMAGRCERETTFRITRGVRLDEPTAIELGPEKGDWRVSANVLVVDPGTSKQRMPQPLPRNVPKQ